MPKLEQLLERFLGASTKDLVPGRILAVDDDAGNLAVLEDLLEDEYEIEICSDPVEALEIFRNGEFDMVITDQRMPEMTGVELLSHIHKLKPETVRIIVSAYADSREILAAINQGFVYRYVLKPWDPADIESVVEQGMEHRFHVLAIRRLADVLSQRNDELEQAIASLKEAQDQLLHSTQLATIGQLTSSIAHELRNHLSIVQTSYNLLTMEDIGDNVTELIGHGNRSVQTLLELVKNINLYARRGSWDVQRNVEDVSGVIADASLMIKMDPRCKSRNLQVLIDNDLPPVSVDGVKLGQVLVNLLRNSLEATKCDDEITVSAHYKLPSQALEICVEDSGEGIAPENLDKLFQPFFTTKEQGLGLGLAICQKIVEAHGGTLEAESTLGSGTRMRISIPIIGSH